MRKEGWIRRGSWASTQGCRAWSPGPCVVVEKQKHRIPAVLKLVLMPYCVSLTATVFLRRNHRDSGLIRALTVSSRGHSVHTVTNQHVLLNDCMDGFMSSQNNNVPGDPLVQGSAAPLPLKFLGKMQDARYI